MKAKRLTLDLDPELHKQLKVLAAERGTTMREVCITALKQHLLIGKALGPDPLLEELWNDEENAVSDNL